MVFQHKQPGNHKQSRRPTVYHSLGEKVKENLQNPAKKNSTLNVIPQHFPLDKNVSVSDDFFKEIFP